MNKTWLAIPLVSLTLLAACMANFTEFSPAGDDTPSAESKTTTGPTLPVAQSRYFSTSGQCAICHVNMVDEAGNDVSNATYWRSTMMANASRDPYWQATVRREILNTPAYRAAIEDKCATCHTPMARFTKTVAGQEGKILDEGFLDPQNEFYVLAQDGVSCTVCHQILQEGLGQAHSFSGSFVIDAEKPPGERDLFGPYPIGKAQADVMKGGSGFAPKQSLHIRQAELCATCHTLYTPTIDESGQIVGEFPEQTPYLEWRHSDYAETTSCQGCHMPHAQGGVQLSITGGKPRSPFSKHTFVGGNVYMGEILKTFGKDLQVTASNEHFDATIERTLDQLQQRTATVKIMQFLQEGTSLTVHVAIKNLAGHKFPTGYPARRAWLHLVAQDAQGQIIFESGQVNPDGSVNGNNNDANPARYEPHYHTIETPEQVQIYETIMVNPNNELTTTLMRGTAYVKDNRLLPLGFDPNTAAPDFAVQGQAAADRDFLGGGDNIQYVIQVQPIQRPLTITVKLLYQSISYRWAENLRQHEGPEIADFYAYYQAVPNQPIIIASDTYSEED
ncbi:MAG: hypothetical protein JW953_18035 [Anaerolineae bacterium]|nr:hypothetical protein [Anaerolineae bacterium]